MKKFIGIFLIIGSTIGGGIIGLPIAAVNLGFIGSLLAICLVWLIMTFTGLCILKISYNMPVKHNTYYSLSTKFLNFKGAKVSVFGSYLLILYLSLTTYISGISSSISSYFSQNSNLSYLLSGVILIFILGGITTYNSRFVIKSNVIFVITKLSLIIIAIFLIFYTTKKVSINVDGYPIESIGALSFLFVLFNAFGYHFIIPSLVKFYNQRISFKAFVYLLIFSTTLIAFIYLAWILAIFFTIPTEGSHGMLSIYNSKNQLIAFNNSISFFTQSYTISNMLSAFQLISMIGSFCCISIGVIDALKDALGQNAYLKVLICTYLPPLVLMCLSQNMFLIAMSLAGILTFYVEVFVPILGVRNYYKTSNKVKDKSLFNYQYSKLLVRS
ncbi:MULTISPECIES: aromatic amino acid transport family protein [unclassified Francisella]|uniref:aromatic amino acid transport family protein n=1 Tax=unclassified Francisella TaxID=2610885 RepID=UPI002E2F838D|nr:MULTISPECIES: aromatic amino acid transport family protein [unclassified Francisella]MED7819523.1 aromatic amino acid transport family protein [Francisella sp. 19S2-4]MED7830312.1 aromatic amino acid transport family protein [Francisella sp. 19S2-10]